MSARIATLIAARPVVAALPLASKPHQLGVSFQDAIHRLDGLGRRSL
jgi:hypothetical protein